MSNFATHLAIVALLAVPCASHAEPTSEGGAKGFNPRLLRRFKPLRPVLAEGPLSAPQVSLGKMLYFDKRLSKGKDVSCQSCHPVDKYGADGETFSKGTHGQRGGRNAPTTFNAAGHFVQFWDGRSPTVEAQAVGPMMNPVEMGMSSGAEVVKRLEAVSEYLPHFQRAFPGQAAPITIDNVASAIGAYERTLVTPSRWDAYLGGDTHALSAAEIEGLRVFTNVGCMVCHTGEMLGGSSYQRVGVVEPWPNQKDAGRHAITKNTEDSMVFKVPSLRNIEKTAPYFHDGSAKTLKEAITLMGRHQLGLELSDEEVAAIGTWLKSLTGTLAKEAVTPPILPGPG